MKKVLLSVATLLLATYISAQTPDAFNYQAVARNTAGQTMNEQVIAVEISIMKNGEYVYTEIHALTTNKYGLFTLNIGNGEASLGDFSAINWEEGKYSIKVAMDENGGSSYTVMGTTPLLTVPYAMHSRTAENVFSGDYNDLINKPGGGSEGIGAGGDNWELDGNAGTTSGIDFIGTVDEEDFDIRVDDIIRFRVTQNGQLEVLNSGKSVFMGEKAGDSDDLSENKNVFIGYAAGEDNKTGGRNNALGYFALNSNTTGSFNVGLGSYALKRNTIGYYNVATGGFALYNNTSGTSNTAIGTYSMYNSSTGSRNVAVGQGAIYSNTSGSDNTTIGYYAMKKNTTGARNVAVGATVLYNNTTGSFNTGQGYQALYKNLMGNNNVAGGYRALYNNESGSNNIATGKEALYSNTIGQDNIATGYQSLYKNRYGNFNIAMGYKSLHNNFQGVKNVAIGDQSLFKNVMGANNVAIGSESGLESTGNFNVFIGNQAGYFSEGDNKLVIANKSMGVGSDLITGDFSTGKVTIKKVLQLPPSNPPVAPEDGDMYVGLDGHVYCYLGLSSNYHCI